MRYNLVLSGVMNSWGMLREKSAAAWLQLYSCSHMVATIWLQLHSCSNIDAGPSCFAGKW